MKRNETEYCVTCGQMKKLEQDTDAAGLSYYQMMENAGTIAAHRIVEITITSPINDEMTPDSGDGGGLPDAPGRHREDGCFGNKRYVYQLDRPIRSRIYVGKGNNGGDGLVVARLLHQRGWQVEIILVDGQPTTPDAIANFDLAQRLAIPIRSLTEEEQAPAGEDKAGLRESKGETATLASPNRDAETGRRDEVLPDVVVDAVYGTGFHGVLRESGAEAARQIAEAKRSGARVFALDIPSGMGGDLTDEADLDPRCVRADVTITFHAKKPVHLQPFADKYCGRIITADIGILDPNLPDANQPSRVNPGETPKEDERL